MAFLPVQVSIVIPTKDRLGLLQETLVSICRQTYFNWEAVVVDDGSKDGTWEWLEIESRREPRIRGIRRPEVLPECRGVQVCRNLGCKQSRGAFVLFLDSDDLLGPDCLAQRTAILLTDQKCDFVVGQCERFDTVAGDRPSDIWAPWPADQNDLDAFLGIGLIPWQTAGPLWRKSALDKVGPWDVDVQLGHDHEFHVRALCLGIMHRKIELVDYYWRRPRVDSYSSFESFKRHHASGGLIGDFCKLLENVSRYQQWTKKRQQAQATEVVQLAVKCLLFGGKKSSVRVALRGALNHKLINRLAYLELIAIVGGWYRVGGKIPALTYLRHRFSRAFSKYPFGQVS